MIAYAVFLTTGIACAEVLIRPNDANINYYGRFDFSHAADSVAFDWPGAVIEAVFPGPSIGVELKDNGSYFDVEIDGVKRDSLPPSAVTHRTISTSLTTANHTIRIALRTNGYRCSFRGLYLADGKTLAAKPAQPVRKMEFIGDSWTAGDVVLQPAGGSTAYLWSFEATLTYARRTSIAFHAQDKLIARGGCGMVTSNGGAATMPVRYTRILCDYTGAGNSWDFASWIPDIVTIFLGINDFNNNVTDANFRTAYTAFINTVRGHYPGVPIILIGLPDNVNGHNILTNVQTVAQSFSGVYAFSSPLRFSQAAALWSHPTPAQNRLIADSLISLVRTVTGWDTTAPTGISVPDVKQEARNAVYANPMAVTTSQDKIVFRPQLPGAVREIIAYDCRGRSLRRLVTGKQTLSLGRDFGLPDGMYIIKTAALR
ncbi:MAG: hypothetical protein JW768_11215 [Chitinispirillaceae bacterium]|nr:hypothetical protein [Chitinispirillaceae bacterium]